MPYRLAMSPNNNDSDENRTRVTAVKGRCLDRLTTEPNALRSSCDRLAMGPAGILSEVSHELRISAEPSVLTTTDQDLYYCAIAPAASLDSKEPRQVIVQATY